MTTKTPPASRSCSPAPILAAGVLKLSCLFGHAGAHIHRQVVVGFVITGVTACLSVRYLVR